MLCFLKPSEAQTGWVCGCLGANPFGPFVTSNSTFWRSCKLLKPLQGAQILSSFMHVGEKCLELAGPRGVAQLAQGLGFDLANALAGNGERAANLLQRVLRAVLQTKAHPHDLLLAR